MKFKIKTDIRNARISVFALFVNTSSYLVEIRDQLVRVVGGDVGEAEFHTAFCRLAGVCVVAPSLDALFVKHIDKLLNLLVGQTHRHAHTVHTVEHAGIVVLHLDGRLTLRFDVRIVIQRRGASARQSLR